MNRSIITLSAVLLMPMTTFATTRESFTQRHRGARRKRK